MSRLRKIGIQLTTRCNMACKHCGTLSSPKANDTIEVEDLIGWIKQIAQLDRRLVVGLTGGEVFTDIELLSEALQLIRNHGLRYGIVTNAYWAEDERLLAKYVDLIRDSATIGLSLDIYHSVFLNPAYVVRAFRYCLDLGLDVHMRVTLVSGQQPKDLLDEYGLNSAPYIDRIHFSGLMPIGRARRFLRISPSIFPDFPVSGGCAASYAPLIRPNGDVLACCGASLDLSSDSALYLGSLQEMMLAEILSRSMASPVLNAIKSSGPQALLKACTRFASSSSNEVLARSPCGACSALFSDKKIRALAEDHCSNMAGHYGELARIQDLLFGLDEAYDD